MALREDRRGQLFQAGSLAFVFIKLLAALLIVGGILILVSDYFLGIMIHQLGVEYGADSRILGWFESGRVILPLIVLIGIGLGALAESQLK